MLQDLSAIRDAEAERLHRAVRSALPCLQRAARPVERAASYRTGNRRRVSVVWRQGLTPVRGIVVDDSYELESRDAGRSGFYVGTRLYLLVDGRFVQVRRFGSWTTEPGSSCSWSICAPGTSIASGGDQDPEVDGYVLSPREVVNLYDLAPVVFALARVGRSVASGMQVDRA
jgi:hypothetical protein